MKRVIILSLFLGGCASSPIKLIAPEYKVVSPPESLYNCPQVKNFGSTEKLTNEQVGQLILKLQKNNMTCKNSLDDVKSYIDQAKQNIDKK